MTHLLLAIGDLLWTPFAVITLGFAANSTKQPLQRPGKHRP